MNLEGGEYGNGMNWAVVLTVKKVNMEKCRSLRDDKFGADAV